MVNCLGDVVSSVAQRFPRETSKCTQKCTVSPHWHIVNAKSHVFFFIKNALKNACENTRKNTLKINFRGDRDGLPRLATWMFWVTKIYQKSTKINEKYSKNPENLTKIY